MFYANEIFYWGVNFFWRLKNIFVRKVNIYLHCGSIVSVADDGSPAEAVAAAGHAVPAGLGGTNLC